ncbi:MAG: hypothetical protein WCF36_19535 [Candidatus Nanopelagicales bacterium]
MVTASWRGFPDWVEEAAHWGVNLPGSACGLDAASREQPVEGARVLRVWTSPEYVEVGQAADVRSEREDEDVVLPRRPERHLRVRDDRTADLDRVRAHSQAAGQSPLQVQFDDVLRSSIASIHGIAERFQVRWGRPLNVALSMKTNPNPGWLALAREGDLVAECISLAEVDHAATHGFLSEDMILNGPGKWWPGLPGQPKRLFGAVFADSLSDLATTMNRISDGDVGTRTLGVRVRPEGIDSRFGIPLHETRARHDVVAALQALSDDTRIGVHLHVAASNLGVTRWRQAARAAVVAAAQLQDELGRAIEVVDFGGGWVVDEWNAMATCLDVAALTVCELLPEVDSFIVEPGKSLTQSGYSTLMRVLSVDHVAGAKQIVLTGSFWDCPDVLMYPHEVLWSAESGGPWRRLEDGPDRLLGRLCMETDIVKHGVAAPSVISVGDFVAVMGTGGYDASLSLEFGAGTSRW